MNDFPIYDINSACAKCKQQGAASAFVEYYEDYYEDKKECILRECKNCGYTWKERPRS